MTFDETTNYPILDDDMLYIKIRKEIQALNLTSTQAEKDHWIKVLQNLTLDSRYINWITIPGTNELYTSFTKVELDEHFRALGENRVLNFQEVRQMIQRECRLLREEITGRITQKRKRNNK